MIDTSPVLVIGGSTRGHRRSPVIAALFKDPAGNRMGLVETKAP